MEKKNKIHIAFDIGVTSVGWCVVDDDGKILDQGNHEELLSHSPVYRELVETQLGGGDFDAE